MNNLTQNLTQSPFDSIRREDADDEYWSARDLMPMLGYDKWQRAADVLDRAMAALKLNGHKPSDHITGGGKMVELGSGSSRRVEDFRLSRLGCYMVAMAGDARKPEIASAHQYFAIKTREAEVVIPAQSEHIATLELELAIAKERTQSQSLILQSQQLEGSMLTMHGNSYLALRGVQVAEVEKPTIEIIDERCNVKFEGQTLAQVAEYLKKRYGIKTFKSGADIKRFLEKQEKTHLIAQTIRTVPSDYVPKENYAALYELLTNGDRQGLLGQN